MDKNDIFSERELTQTESVSWGQWIFKSVSNQEIQDKLLKVPKTHKYASKWNSLYSFLQKNMLEVEHISQKQLNADEVTNYCESMVCSIASDLREDKSTIDPKSDCLLDELVTNIVHVCKQEGPKLNKLNMDMEEVVLIRNDLSSLSEENVKCLMEKTWAQMSSDSSKLRFCELFSSDEHLVKILCKNILFPWLCRQTPRNIDQLSEILSVEGETICRLLIAPLLRVKDSPFVEDLINLEELMISMTVNGWSTLLKELVCGVGELENWQIPIFTMIVEQATPSSGALGSLIQLMSFNGQQFSQNRDFGSLLVAMAQQISPESNSLIPQLKMICNSYKGSLKFKVMKILAEKSK